MLTRRALVTTLAALPLACGKKTPESPPPAVAQLSRGDRIDFDVASLDDRPTSSAATRGRVTVVLFVTTYGDPSLLAARFVAKTFREHTPRFNALAVFLERVENRPLARIFTDQLALPYPAAMGSAEDIAGKGPFKGIDTVPSVVVLDREGREVFRRFGVVKSDELGRILRGAE